MNGRSFAAASARTLPAIEERRVIAYPLFMLLGICMVAPATWNGPQLHDSIAIYWVWADQFTAELARGNLYPRWLPQSYAGLGAPVFYYYPPIAFYLTALFGLLGLSTYWSLIAVFAAAFAGSGATCWHWLKGRSRHPLLGALFFMVAPYHVLNFTIRGAVAESVAIAIIPLLAIGLRRIAERRGGVIPTACAYAAIICTHLPLALLVSLFLIAPYVFVHRARIRCFALALASGLALASIYLVPALSLGPYHDIDQLYRTANLLPPYWSIFAANWSDVTYLAVFAASGTLLLAAFLPAASRKDKWALHAIAMTVIAAGLVPLLWSLPLLRQVQFPFRVLPIAEFSLATALAQSIRRRELAFALLPILISAAFVRGVGFPTEDLTRLRNSHPDVYEYLPRGVIPPGQTRVTLKGILETRVPPPKVAGAIVEPLFYFPAWSCGVPEPRTQLLQHDPACRPRLRMTVAEKVGAAVTLLAALLLALMALGMRRRHRLSAGQ